MANADELLLATDEDREGEAIAWHLLQVLKPKIPVHRMVFHEITRDAIRAAVESPRELDQRMVDAQEARRIIDRLYGYEVSPVLWKKVTSGLSAGRVQSVATRLVVERERERMAFVSAAYWDIAGRFDPTGFEATLVAVDGARIARGSDFDQRGQLKSEGVIVLDEASARITRRGAAGRFAFGSLRRGEAVPTFPCCTIHYVDAAAGSQPEASDDRSDGDAGCAATVRERLHHVYANRLDDPVGECGGCGTCSGHRALRCRSRSRQAPNLGQEGQERTGSSRSDSPGRRCFPYPRTRLPAKCRRTN